MSYQSLGGKPLFRGGRVALVNAGEPIEQTSPAESALTISEFKSQRVFQRQGTSKEIELSGTYVGADPLAVEARLINAEDGSVASEWLPLSSSLVGSGSFSGKIVAPQGGWYKTQIRDSAKPTAVTTSTNKWGVGVVIALIGQSNMANFQTTASKYPLGSSSVVEYEGNVFRRVGNINDALPPNTLFGSGGYGTSTNVGSRADGYVYLGNLVSSGLNVPVCLVERAVGGSQIASWMTGQTNWNNFAAAATAAGGDFEVVLWLQGESDNSMSKANMLTRLSALHSQLRAYTGRNDQQLNFGIISLGPVSLDSSYSGNSDSKFGVIRSAQVQYANSNSGSFFVTSALDNRAGDGVHISSEGFARIGRRYAKSVLARLGVGSSGAGPRAVSAVRSGLDVNLTLQHTGGTALLDGAGGNGSALTGFVLRDSSGNLLGVNSTIITGPNTVRISADSEPSTISYGLTNSPHTSVQSDASSELVISSVLYDNSFYLDGVKSPFGLSQVGSPLQPFEPMVIT